MGFEQATDLALKNIAKHGDTDIFPFPFETHVFFDRPEDCKKLLQDIHERFDDYLSLYPPSTIETLTQISYTGFRWARRWTPKVGPPEG